MFCFQSRRCFLAKKKKENLLPHIFLFALCNYNLLFVFLFVSRYSTFFFCPLFTFFFPHSCCPSVCSSVSWKLAISVCVLLIIIRHRCNHIKPDSGLSTHSFFFLFSCLSDIKYETRKFEDGNNSSWVPLVFHITYLCLFVFVFVFLVNSPIHTHPQTGVYLFCLFIYNDRKREGYQ